MSLRARRGRLLAVTLLSAAALAGATIPAVSAAASRPGGSSPAAQASNPAAATNALKRVFRVHGPLPLARVPSAVLPSVSIHRVGGAPIALSGNWSGYADDASTGRTYTAVTAAWVEPKISCTPTEDELAGFWVGLDGFTTNTVEQAGTFGWCYQGHAYHYTWWEMFPDGAVVVGNSVSPGDHISASVTATSKGYRLVVTDSTRPANSFSTMQQCPFGSTCANASAEWVAETPSGTRGTWPWPSFGTWHLTGAKATSGTKTGSIGAFPDDQIVIVGDDGDTLASTGSLNSAANAFNLTWSHAY